MRDNENFTWRNVSSWTWPHFFVFFHQYGCRDVTQSQENLSDEHFFMTDVSIPWEERGKFNWTEHISFYLERLFYVFVAARSDAFIAKKFSESRRICTGGKSTLKPTWQKMTAVWHVQKKNLCNRTSALALYYLLCRVNHQPPSQKETPELEATEPLFCKRCLNNLPSYLSSYRACVIVSALSALFSLMPLFLFFVVFS